MMKTTAFLALALAAAASAQAMTIALPADGSWSEFDVDATLALSHGTEWIDNTADGSPLNFTFTVPAGYAGTLTIVDGGFAGDTFTVRNGNTFVGVTTTVAAGTTAGDLVFDYDEALANPAYSRGVFTLAAGSYSINGSLLQSVTDGGQPLNATFGGVKLTVSAVPEPASVALLLAGLGVIGFLSSRARRN